MSFTAAIRRVLVDKYATFSGRAGRAEYWWFVLASVLGSVVTSVLDLAVTPVLLGLGPFGLLLTLALLLPGTAVLVRRIHDTDRSAWWLLAVYGPTLLGLLAAVAGSVLVLQGAFGSAAETGGDGLATGALLLLLSAVLFLGGAVVSLVLTLQAGTPGPNRYGDPDPGVARHPVPAGYGPPPGQWPAR